MICIISTALFCLERPNQDVRLLVSVKVTPTSLARNLYNTKIASNPLFARVYAVFIFFMKEKKRIAGVYHIKAGTHPFKSIYQISQVKSGKLKITIPEGFTNAQVVKRINNCEFLSGHIKHLPPEGTLFPSTYSYLPDESRQSIIDRMYAFNIITIKNLLNGRKIDIEKLITLASIIEKETLYEDERALVSAVYLNRLKIGMRLQSCPTVIYSITYGNEKFPYRLRKEHLFNISAFNTYRCKGLPPAPICNPSKESLEAAINPADVDFLFFVSNNKNPSSKHIFSKTLNEHIVGRKNLSK